MNNRADNSQWDQDGQAPHQASFGTPVGRVPDHRPEAARLSRLQSVPDNSPDAAKIGQLLAKANQRRRTPLMVVSQLFRNDRY